MYITFIFIHFYELYTFPIPVHFLQRLYIYTWNYIYLKSLNWISARKEVRRTKCLLFHDWKGWSKSDDYCPSREMVSYTRNDADVHRIRSASRVESHGRARPTTARNKGRRSRSICSPPKIHAHTYGGEYPTFSVPGLRDTKRGNCTHSGPESGGWLKEGGREGGREGERERERETERQRERREVHSSRGLAEIVAVRWFWAIPRDESKGYGTQKT